MGSNGLKLAQISSNGFKWAQGNSDVQGNRTRNRFGTFPSLGFYVKSILVISKSKDQPYWPFEQLWILNFLNFWQFPVWNFFKHQNSKPPKLLKLQFLTVWNMPKLISRKIRVVGKFLNLPYCRISTVKIPN